MEEIKLACARDYMSDEIQIENNCPIFDHRVEMDLSKISIQCVRFRMSVWIFKPKQAVLCSVACARSTLKSSACFTLYLRTD